MKVLKENLPETHPRDKRLHEAFVDLSQAIPGILVDLRYATSDNFVGRPICGYQNKTAVLTRPAARALAVAQSLAKKQGLQLKLYDAYRPQKAVDAFAAWSKDENDLKMKKNYYPNKSKIALFSEGYIFLRSGHSRGSTVDLTLVPFRTTQDVHDSGQRNHVDSNVDERRHSDEKTIDMGGGFDVFDASAQTSHVAEGSEAQRNRRILVELMHQAGFENYAKEWWHFTLRDEPFPNTYFDFDP